MFGVKSAIVWAYSNKSNSCSPALYITKPKHVSQSDYDLMLEKIKIAFEQ
jgi:hypothetical protein